MNEKHEAGEFSITALMKQVDEGQETMQLWTDEKKGDFVKLFHDRVAAAKYILFATAKEIANAGLNRRFISQRKIQDAYNGNWEASWDFGEFPRAKYIDGHYTTVDRIGGRTRDDLDTIADERAKKVIKEMPMMKDAVKVIAPDVAAKIEKRDKLQEEGQKLFDALEEYQGTLYMGDYPNMKICDFMDMLKERTKARKKIVDKLEEIGDEGLELDSAIDKALFRGLPGLDDAIKELVKDHIERAKALDQFDRRVEEKIKFGDSQAAVDILQQFEKDEQAVSDKIKGSFQGALDKLKLLAKGGKSLKQLQSKKE
jgi:hypothetical protein